MPTTPPPDDVAGLRVLTVEDHADGAESLALLLRMDGHEVEIARDGPTAVETAGPAGRTWSCSTWPCRG